MPRQYKGMFTAHDEDYLIGESDGSQLEFRVAADLGHDDVALAEIIEGADIHSFTAKVMIDAGHPDFKGLTVKEGRQKAKAHTFAPLFGSTGKHPAEKEYVEFFTTKYAGISATQRGWCLDVLSKGWMSTPYGMRFYWPGTTMSKSGYIENSTAIKNYSVQSFATGEIIPIALVHFWHRTRGMPIHIFNTIHDSVVSRVHKDFVKQYEDISRQSFTYDVYSFLNDVYNYQFKVPLGIGLKVAKHWGEGDIEKSWDVFPDGREVYKEK